MSPELLHPDQFGFEDSRPTKESDCYALGMVIYEVLSGQTPFTSLKDFVVMRKVVDGERPARPEGSKGAWFTDDLWGMIELCWTTRPDSRPNIATVFERLEQVSKDWIPPSPQAEEDLIDSDEDDWHFTLTVSETPWIVRSGSVLTLSRINSVGHSTALITGIGTAFGDGGPTELPRPRNPLAGSKGSVWHKQLHNRVGTSVEHIRPVCDIDHSEFR